MSCTRYKPTVVVRIPQITHFREFATSIPRPFQFRYDPYTERLLVVNHREDMALSMRKIEEEMKRLQRAVGKLDL
jgi:hypothetical protein